jgi:hypothetical protein
MARRKAQLAEPLELTEAQRQAVDLLTLGQRAGDVAQAVGTTPEAIAEWRQTPLFMAAVNAQLQDTRESTRQRLRGLASVALDTVEQVLGDLTAPPQLRLQAALRVLDLVGAKDYAKAEIGSADPADVVKEQQRDRFMKDLF